MNDKERIAELENALRGILTAWEGSVNTDDLSVRILRGEIEKARSCLPDARSGYVEEEK